MPEMMGTNGQMVYRDKKQDTYNPLNYTMPITQPKGNRQDRSSVNRNKYLKTIMKKMTKCLSGMRKGLDNKARKEGLIERRKAFEKERLETTAAEEKAARWARTASVGTWSQPLFTKLKMPEEESKETATSAELRKADEDEINNLTLVESDEEDDECYVSCMEEQLNARYEDSCNEVLRAMEAGEKRLMSDKIGKELWVFSVIDDNPMKADESELPQVGGVVIKGNLQMMTLPYFLRRSTRRRGKEYEVAVDNLLKMCQIVGIPNEVKSAIVIEINELLQIIDKKEEERKDEELKQNEEVMP
jgi:hypothetical protein